MTDLINWRTKIKNYLNPRWSQYKYLRAKIEAQIENIKYLSLILWINLDKKQLDYVIEFIYELIKNMIYFKDWIT